MDEMNKFNEEQNDSEFISELNEDGSAKTRIAKWPFVVGGLAVLLAIALVAATFILGGGSGSHEHI